MSVDAAEVPTMEQSGALRLPGRALSYLHIRSATELTCAALAAIALVLWALEGSSRHRALLTIGVLTVLGLALELPILNRYRLRYTRYSVSPTFVFITRGALVRRSVLIPTRQILNVETVQGPLLRRFDFAKVRFKCITEVETLGPLDPAAVLEIRRVVALLKPHSRAR